MRYVKTKPYHWHEDRDHELACIAAEITAQGFKVPSWLTGVESLDGRIGYLLKQHGQDCLVEFPEGFTIMFFANETEPVYMLGNVADFHIKWLHNMEIACQELHAYHAPSECSDLVFKGCHSEYAEGMGRSGWNDADFLRWFERRTNRKCAYNFSVGGMVV